MNKSCLCFSKKHAWVRPCAPTRPLLGNWRETRETVQSFCKVGRALPPCRAAILARAMDTAGQATSPCRSNRRSCATEGDDKKSEHHKKASSDKKSSSCGKPMRISSGTVVWVRQAGFPWWPCVIFRSWSAWQRFGLPWPRPETTDELKKRAASADYASGSGFRV